MQAVIQHGTGAAALSLGRVDLAGKTGTSQNFHDAWFDGFNPDLVAITWMGYNNQREMFPGSIVANMFAFLPAESLKIESDTKREAPKVSFS